MDSKQAGRELDLNTQLRAVALANDGVLSLEILFRLGLSWTMVQKRKEAGRLLPILRGSFALPGTRLSFRGRLRASVASVSSNVVVSHGSALALHGLIRDPGPVHLTGESGAFRDQVSGRWNNDAFNLKVVRHETRHLPPEHITELDGIRVTTAERAIRDFAATAKPSEVTKALTQGEKERKLCWHELRLIADASNGHKGIGVLRNEIDEWDPVFADTISDPEIDFLRMIRRERMPKPLVNHPVGRHIPDFLWKHLCLAVELDPYGTHSGKASHRRDHRKGIELETSGLRVVRFTWEDRYLHEERTASELWTVLRQQASLLQCSLFPNGVDSPRW